MKRTTGGVAKQMAIRNAGFCHCSYISVQSVGSYQDLQTDCTVSLAVSRAPHETQRAGSQETEGIGSGELPLT